MALINVTRNQYVILNTAFQTNGRLFSAAATIGEPGTKKTCTSLEGRGFFEWVTSRQAWRLTQLGEDAIYDNARRYERV